MAFRLMADGVLLLHLAFILFVLLGAVMALRWRRMPYVHVPAATWGFFVELTGRACPLTYMENYFRIKAGHDGYADSFIEHYILNIIYPTVITRDVQFVLAGVVVVINVAIYGWLLYRWRHGSRPAD